jgi:hypothetical protein
MFACFGTLALAPRKPSFAVFYHILERPAFVASAQECLAIYSTLPFAALDLSRHFERLITRM